MFTAEPGKNAFSSRDIRLQNTVIRGPMYFRMLMSWHILKVDAAIAGADDKSPSQEIVIRVMGPYRIFR
ncbi:hypothetical protein B2D07_07905 [Desulfococcus multivorans]|nr:hypothetical protein B2D07_07905 [Desulfococcus multivorans]